MAKRTKSLRELFILGFVLSACLCIYYIYGTYVSNRFTSRGQSAIYSSMPVSHDDNNIDINTNASIIISPYFSRVIDNEYAVFCTELKAGGGLGNQLESYWTARAIAYFANWTFVMNDDVNTITKHINISCNTTKKFKMFNKRKHMHWTWFLSYEYDERFSSDRIHYNLSINKEYNQMWKHTVIGPHRFKDPLANMLMFTAFNSYFIPVIQNNTRDAFDRYYNYAHSGTDHNYWVDSHKRIFYESWMKELENKNTNIIVIHIRMGDILYQTYRYMLNMKYFSTALDLILKHMQENDRDFIYKHCKIKIVSQLSDVNAHNGKDLAALNMSRQIVYFMAEEMQKYVESTYRHLSASYEIIGNDTIDNDYYKLITTSYLICSSSTLCFACAMANFYDPKLIIMPQTAAWRHQIKEYRAITDNAKFGLLQHYKWINTTLMVTLSCELFSNCSIRYLNKPKRKRNKTAQLSQINFFHFKDFFLL